MLSPHRSLGWGAGKWSWHQSPGCGDPEGILSISGSTDFCKVCWLVLLWKSLLALLTLIYSSHNTPLLQLACVCLVTQLCPTLDHPMNCNSSGSSVHGIFLARILEWVAIPSCRGSSQPRDWTWLSCTAGRFFTTEPPGNPYCRYRFGNNAAISCSSLEGKKTCCYYWGHSNQTPRKRETNQPTCLQSKKEKQNKKPLGKTFSSHLYNTKFFTAKSKCTPFKNVVKVNKHAKTWVRTFCAFLEFTEIN